MADYSVRFLNETEYDVWDNFVENHPNGTVFQTSVFLKTISEASSHEFKIAAIFNQDELLGGFAFSTVKRYGFNLIPLPYECPVYQPVFIERKTQYISKKESLYNTLVENLTSFLNLYFDSVKMNFSFNSIDLRPYKSAKYKFDINYTYLLDFNLYDVNSVPFNSSIKKQIKKAKRNNYSILKGVNAETVQIAYELLSQTYSRQGLSLRFSKEQYESIYTKLYEKGWFQLYVLSFDNKPASVMGVTTFNSVAHHHLSASNPELYQLGGTSALMTELLNDLKNNNQIKKFDFAGANTKTVARFKAGFNFPLIPIYSIVYEKNIVTQLFKIKRFLKR